MSEVLALYVGGDSELVEFFTQIGRHCGGGWTGSSVPDGDAALKALGERDYNLVLVDSTLPDFDACALLEKVREANPSMLRFVVAEVADKASMIRLLTAAHQVIAKPCVPRTLARQLLNGVGLHNFLSDKKLIARVAGIKSLPCLPETYSKLTFELAGDRASAKRIAELVSADAAVTAKLLQVVNSAYFGLSRRVEDVTHAVNLVGFDTVQSLVLSAGAFDSFQGLNIPGSSINEIYGASVRVGVRSRLLAHSFGAHARATEDSLLGGMLHTIGMLVMAKYFRTELDQALTMSRQNRISLTVAEEEIMGVSDAAIGAYLLSLWGLSTPIVEAVALYHRPSRCASPEVGPLTFVHLGWAMADDERRNVKDEKDSSVDTAYLEALGLRGQLPALRGYCAGAMA